MWVSNWKGVMGLSCALCVGSTMIIVIKQNNWRQSRGSWGTILCLASSCPGAQAGADTAFRASADKCGGSGRMGKRWSCLCTAMTNDLTRRESICRQR